jgi:hypothetical protein
MEQERREDLVRDRAQQIWEREGKKDGDHERHWSQAEQEIRKDQVGEDGAGETRSKPAAKRVARKASPAACTLAGCLQEEDRRQAPIAWARRTKAARASPGRTEQRFYER